MSTEIEVTNGPPAAVQILIAVLVLAFLGLMALIVINKGKEGRQEVPITWEKHPEGQPSPQPTMPDAKIEQIGQATWSNGFGQFFRPVFRIEYDGVVYIAVDQGGIIEHKPKEEQDD